MWRSTMRGIVQLIRSQTEAPHTRSILMKPLRRHDNHPEVVVTAISKHGIWLLSTTKEFFIPFNEYPRFRDASVTNIFHVEQPTPNRLHWPHLGMTVSLESLRCFPLPSSTSQLPTRSETRTQVTRVTQSKVTLRPTSRQNNRRGTPYDPSQGSTGS